MNLMILEKTLQVYSLDSKNNFFLQKGDLFINTKVISRKAWRVIITRLGLMCVPKTTMLEYYTRP